MPPKFDPLQVVDMIVRVTSGEVGTGSSLAPKIDPLGHSPKKIDEDIAKETGLEGPPYDDETHRSEPPGEGDSGALRRRTCHQCTQRAREGQEKEQECKAQWKHHPKRRD